VSINLKKVHPGGDIVCGYEVPGRTFIGAMGHDLKVLVQILKSFDLRDGLRPLENSLS
jgi:hypothetical protein